MQRISYVNTGYIHDVYSKYGSLLNDDMIYSGLARLDETCTVSRALFGKSTVRNIAVVNATRVATHRCTQWSFVFSESSHPGGGHQGNIL